MRTLLTLLTLLALPAAVARGELKIVTTTTDFADLAKQIGGDKVNVHSVMKGPENVHNILAKPTEMVFLNKADLFVHAGLDGEPWRDSLLKGARNPRVMPGGRICKGTTQFNLRYFKSSYVIFLKETILFNILLKCYHSTI
jgi:ABC-type Zn uptake system ZnuABC Zn-binding protein ZnuA